MIFFLKKLLTLTMYGGGIFYEKINKLPKNVHGYNNFDEVLKRYSTKPDLTSLAVKNVEYFLKYECLSLSNDFKKVNSILDVGCGNASYSIIFDKLNLFSNKYKYFGIEIDKNIISFCQNKYPMHQFKVSTAENIDFNKNTFNMVFCSGTLHYTLNNWKIALKEMARVSNRFIFITRLPTTKYNKSFLVHQTVLSKMATENHYFKVVNNMEFESQVKALGLTIYKKDYTPEVYYINGVNETVILSSYLLIKNK